MAKITIDAPEGEYCNFPDKTCPKLVFNHGQKYPNEIGFCEWHIAKLRGEKAPGSERTMFHKCDECKAAEVGAAYRHATAWIAMQKTLTRA